MKINFVIDSCSRASGGVFDAERRLWQTLTLTGLEVSVFALNDSFTGQDLPAWLPIVPKTFPVSWPSALGRSTQLASGLLAEPADLIYQAGLWKWSSRHVREWCRQHNKPVIISPHGMLDRWAVKNSGWKKRIALFLYERENLKHAACIRGLCESEAKAVRAFGLSNPICVIPNGIDLSKDRNPASEVKSYTSALSRLAAGKKGLLYLGRIHPKKGLVNLIHAWALVENLAVKGEWVLTIAGWDQGGLEAELKLLATELGLAWADGSGKRAEDTTKNASLLVPRSSRPVSLLFLGPQFNEAKDSAYANCDAFILPSFSEGLPMVILEAWANGKPVLMTPECNLPQGFAANAALRIEATVDGIVRGLRELFAMSADQRENIGSNGFALASRDFAWPKIARQMLSVYEWILGGGAKPDCVIN